MDEKHLSISDSFRSYMNKTFFNDEISNYQKILLATLKTSEANFKNDAAAYRYELEEEGTTATVQSTEVSLSTKRGEREVFAQRHGLMGDSDTVAWKFSEGWLTLSKADVATLANAINTHVQTQFDWEESKNTAIDATADLAALDTIEIRPPEPEPELPE